MIDVRVLFLEAGANAADWFCIDTIKMPALPREGDMIVFSKPCERTVVVTKMFWSNFPAICADHCTFFPVIFVRDDCTSHDMPGTGQ